jgi:hypothetical protein
MTRTFRLELALIGAIVAAGLALSSARAASPEPTYGFNDPSPTVTRITPHKVQPHPTAEISAVDSGPRVGPPDTSTAPDDRTTTFVLSLSIVVGLIVVMRLLRPRA